MGWPDRRSHRRFPPFTAQRIVDRRDGLEFLGIAPMTPAERQVRHRAKLRQRSRQTPTSPAPRIPPRPRRWAAAVGAHQSTRRIPRWLDKLPPNLEGSSLAEKLQAIAELDLEELQTIDPPRGTAATDTGGLDRHDPIAMAILLNLTHATPICRGRRPWDGRE